MRIPLTLANKFSIRLGLALAGLVLISGVAGQTVFADPDPTVSGVVRFNDTPAALNSIHNGVDVDFISTNNVRWGSRTDNDGVYSRSLTPFVVGNYNAELSYNTNYTQENSAVTGMPNSFLLTTTQPIFNYQGSSISQDFNFVTKSVAITVKDHNGNPVSGRNVSVTNVGATTVTSADGITFSLPDARSSSQNLTNGDGVATVSVFPGSTYRACVTTGFTYPVQYCNDVVVTDNTAVAINYNVPPTLSGEVRFSGNAPTVGSPSIEIITSSGQLRGIANINTSGNYSFDASYLQAQSYKFNMAHNTAYQQNNSAVTGVPNSFLLKSVTPVISYGYTNISQNLYFNTKKLTMTVKDSNGNHVNGVANVTAYGDNTITTTDSAALPFQLDPGAQSSNPILQDDTATVAIFANANYQACATIQNVQYCRPVNINTDTNILISPTPAAPTNLSAPSPSMVPVLNWTAVSGAASYKIYRDNTNIASTTTTTYTDSTAADGTHTYYVTAVSSVGAESNASNTVNVLKDTVRPVMSFTSPTSFAGPFTTGPVVSVDASDVGSGLRTLVIHVYTGANQLLSTCGTASAAQLAAQSMSCDLSSLANGTYYIKAGSFDNAGNNKTIVSSSFVISHS